MKKGGRLSLLITTLLVAASAYFFSDTNDPKKIEQDLLADPSKTIGDFMRYAGQEDNTKIAFTNTNNGILTLTTEGRTDKGETCVEEFTLDVDNLEDPGYISLLGRLEIGGEEELLYINYDSGKGPDKYEGALFTDVNQGVSERLTLEAGFERIHKAFENAGCESIPPSEQ